MLLKIFYIAFCCLYPTIKILVILQLVHIIKYLAVVFVFAAKWIKFKILKFTSMNLVWLKKLNKSKQTLFFIKYFKHYYAKSI